ncbi:GPI ethanolamine phosphate transferase 1 isoform X2 [Glycine soja]|uniref:GPI ethanolamine phosphate transferase 1 isoform X2 n=1 Tax=Glycine max TaxID=3847 RepID=UPI0007191C1F|nr:GPI ethanolamine phosphate transferase 1 isoform X2 [Glycine max]XP_028233060.1 GPI ethanolamine phosphate transferase 1 isoform X2 [Glycine soja]|eukprot:XP_014629470.1 GPI ethanolamine phosphate transferase 1 isoform X2 [Glycine max]
MHSDGILGNREGSGRKWLRRRERWLVVLGVILHAVYMLSIFDIYFKTPIVHGVDPVTPRFAAPAKRLVLLVADGLRADKFFELDAKGNQRAPFLRSIIETQGRWGVSHARPPTESRPGHVAIIAGFYEDPSAVTKGWKANPVEFDSVFNRSRHTISFGSPDIVPIFCGALQHTTWDTYPHEFEDFATDASFLDMWSLDKFQSLLNRSREDPKLKELLQQDNLVVFLHLLGCDSNGHAHRPFSSIYLNNVKVVDHVAESVYNLVQDYFKDNRTSYIFTADHGMSDKGSHGDGHPSNTDTPLVAWGAGVKYPRPISSSNHSDCGFRFVDDHVHDTPTPVEWGLNEIERVDVNQADIAPLMSTLLGLPCPVNSVGSLPLDYINMTKSYTSLPGNAFGMEQAVQKNNRGKIYLYGSMVTGMLCLLLLLEQSPPLYHAYIIMTSFLWVRIISEYQFIKTLWKHLSRRRMNYIIKLLAITAISVFILEFLVNSFTERKLYTWCFLIAGATASFYLFKSIPWRSGIPIYVCLACWFLSLFTLMPAEIPDNNQLVVSSGVIIIIIGIVARWLDLHAGGRKYWLSICNCKLKSSKFSSLFYLQALLVALSSVMVYLSTVHRTEKRELLASHQLINWSVAGFSMVLPLFSENSLLSRLTSIFLGFAPPFLLLSIGYEAIFYAALALVLMAWILFENTILNLNIVNKSSDSTKSVTNHLIHGSDNRSLQLSDVRIPLVFMVLFNVAFFGTGNFASIASFEISSVYRFITIFSPFLMAALLIFKLFIPFLLVICVFSAITKLNQVPRLGCYFLVILFSDMMTIHFFFLVRNTGSWMEIGNSISHFGIMSAQVVFVLLLFALTNTYTKDIHCNSAVSSTRKAN